MRLKQMTREYISDTVGTESRDDFKQLAIVGCSSSGTANVPVVKSTGSSIQAAFGYGFLTRFGARALSKLNSPIIVVKAATTTVGACGEMRFAASSADAESELPDDVGTIVFSGEAYDAFRMQLRISTGGDLTEAQYELSEDAGVNWSLPKALTGAIVLTDKNVTITPDVTNGDFVAGNVYLCDTTGPLTNEVSLTAALEALNAFTTLNAAVVCIGQGWPNADFDDIVGAVEAEAPNGEANLNTYVALVNSRRQALGETDDEFRESIESINTTGVDNPRVMKCWGQVQVRDSLTRTRPWRNMNEEVALAICARADMREDLMQPGVGFMPDVADADIVTTSTDLLVQQNWLCTHELPKRAGFYISAGLLNASETTDMVMLQYRQLFDATQNRLQVFAQNYYGKPMITNSTTGKVTSEQAKTYNKAFETAVASLVDGQVFLDFRCDTSESYLDGISAVLVVRFYLEVAASIGKVVLRGTLSIGISG